MPSFNAAFVHSQQTSQENHSFIADAIQGAGGILLPKESASRGQALLDVQKRLREADVIVIDVTAEDIALGYEIGYCLRLGDQRLVFVTFHSEPTFIEKLHFNLRRRPVLSLSDCLANGPKAHFQRQRLMAAITSIGERERHHPIPLYPRVPKHDSHAESLLGHADVIIRAPLGVFLFGELAAMIGHAAVHLPIPRYLYVGIRSLASDQHTRLVWASVNDEGRIQQHPLMVEYRDSLGDALSQALPRYRPMEITVWSQAPAMCGLGTSSAIAACLAIYIARHEGVLANSEYMIPAPVANGNLLRAGSQLDRVFRIAWKLDRAFHSGRGSGAGAFASLMGTHGVNPLIFLSAARRVWDGDCGKYPWNLADSGSSTGIDHIPCFGFRPELAAGEVTLKPWHFALVSTGLTQRTAWAMSNLESMGRYLIPRPEMLLATMNGLQTAYHAGTTLRRSVSMLISDEYQALLEQARTSGSSGRAILDKHARVSLATLLEAYGHLTMAGINSYWSPSDDKFLALMEACQSILESMGLAHFEYRTRILTEPSRLAHALNSARDDNGLRIFGAKTADGGSGGDLIVMSNLRQGDAFERHLRQVLTTSKYASEAPLPEYARVHFSSTWVDGFPGAYVAAGARLIRED